MYWYHLHQATWALVDGDLETGDRLANETLAYGARVWADVALQMYGAQVAYLRFREAEENRQHADVARAEREALKLLREEQSAAVIAQGRERVAERLARPG